MTETLPLRIFLASPSGLADERTLLDQCVKEHNAMREADSNLTFEVVGWESIRGTVRRPQEAINELIAESHFLVAMFKGTWGSRPGGYWAYTSGTEEELFTGLLALGQSDQLMRDAWVAFHDHPSPDPRIGELRTAISNSNALMYESVADRRELKEKFAQRLLTWESFAGRKITRHIDLLPSSGKDVLGAQRCRINGEKLIELSQIEPGQELLRKASAMGGPEEQLACATFELRHGDIDRAQTEIQKAIDEFVNGTWDLNTPLAAEVFAAQARIVGKEGRTTDAVGHLQTALTLLDDDDPYARRTRARILDDLGLAQRADGDLVSAREAFEESRDIRVSLGDEVDLAQSLVNLARLEVREGDLPGGADLALQAAAILRSTPPSALGANAQVLAAQLCLRQNVAADGIPHAEKALSINRQLGNKRGEAISLHVLAQCLRDNGSLDEARTYANACLELNVSLGDDKGVSDVQRTLDTL